MNVNSITGNPTIGIKFHFPNETILLLLTSVGMKYSLMKAKTWHIWTCFHNNNGVCNTSNLTCKAKMQGAECEKENDEKLTLTF